ncbi:PAS domain S-box-containing protein [Flexibacter flexilis DSM 6793]|uniref:PAS domain S-box-containing protein n=1 Tax=Flexibacter flexilis DSM 6793 TaxID=927664 RepID=A0A1I1N2J9_9BACT|nr:PAS domain S-box protein [Flexibacter flexilis]SFC91894.1 PAS domain S-box-containing protein [Flexibacter flexilis DSM 6793]
MFRKITVGKKITMTVLAVVMLSVVILSFIAFKLSQQAVMNRYMESINVIADIKAQRIDSYFKNQQTRLKFLQELSVLKDALRANSGAPAADGLEAMAAAESVDFGAAAAPTVDFKPILDPLLETYGYANLYLVSPDGKFLYNAHEGNDDEQTAESFNDPDGNTLREAAKGVYFSSVYKGIDNHLYMLLAAPIKDEADHVGGIIIGKLNMTELYGLIQDTIGLGKTGETIVGKLFEGSRKVVFQNSLRHHDGAALRKEVIVGEASMRPLQEAVKKQNGFGVETDYRREVTLSAWRYLPIVNWGMVVKIDQSEVLEPTQKLKLIFFSVGLLIFLVSAIVTTIFSRALTNPLLNLKETMLLLGKGILPNQIQQRSSDEIGEMTATVNQLVEGLKRTANFAHKIGEGDFQADFKPMSEGDTLGVSLMNMRQSLQDASKRDDERNWIVRGVAEIGEILRRHNEIASLGDEIVSFITNKVGAIQGAFYVVDRQENGKTSIELKSSYAYNKKKYLSAKFNFGEGLVGQAAIEQDTILRTEIPYDYVSITSGLLGDRRPSCILIVPLITNEEVNGVLELAGFERFAPAQVRFVQEISQIIARTIFNIQVNERTRNLLAASQKMSFELQQQQEELRQNAEEMAATQEELKRSNIQLEEQIEEVNRTQKRMQVLLENASEVITIYEEDGTIRYISPSVEKILGYRPEEMIGIKDIVYVHEEGVAAVDKMFADLMADPDHTITIQFSYMRKNGERIWLEATGTNLLSDPAIEGIVVNSRDITERRRAEKESRMRGQMQALSENSPDLITRVNKEGKFFYINPVIEQYTGVKPSDLLRTNINETSLEGGLLEAWRNIIDQVLEKQDKVATEIDFNSFMGNRMMHVSAIPEYNEEQRLESVLLVSHDITERKLIELEIQTKNKKITESINYAKRIQVAILPDNETIQYTFPDSFILYKPRDVVSGDFPWFLQKDDDIFIAAVDCTGHGVPGALISLIGYFLLNNVLKDFSDTGTILDSLDEAVTKTLRQDGGDSATRDGMDIALCRINKTTRQMQFSGAHRPLYYLSANGELEEIKGDKFPIGGGQYKNRSNFATRTIDYNDGDVLVFCSDGFPDQFGGRDNRKFSPKRIREILQNNGSKPMMELSNIYDTEFEEWKGDGKQTDDVLMIGIRL